jgi:hypothetical protein
MSVLELLILLHLLLLTYWLGADLGVFYSSRYVLKTELGTQARMTSLKIMVWLDMAPRICLVLFLPSGVSLMAASSYGEQFRWWPLVAIWVFSLAWLGLVLADHHYAGTPTGARIKNLDLLVRFGVMAGVIGAGLYTLLVDEPFGVTTNPKWLGAKVALYGCAIACGVLIRFKLKPFGPALGQLATTGSTPEVERDLQRSIKGSVPFVLGIWVLVIAIAALGVIKPGANV